jgi:hypothetical protein
MAQIPQTQYIKVCTSHLSHIISFLTAFFEDFHSYRRLHSFLSAARFSSSPFGCILVDPLATNI